MSTFTKSLKSILQGNTVGHNSNTTSYNSKCRVWSFTYFPKNILEEATITVSNETHINDENPFIHLSNANDEVTDETSDEMSDEMSDDDAEHSIASDQDETCVHVNKRRKCNDFLKSMPEWCKLAYLRGRPYPKITHVCGQWERALTTDRIHFQGCLRFANPVRLATVRRLDPDQCTHWTIGSTYQSLAECVKYTQKAESKISKHFRLGDWSIVQGTRSDLNYLKQVIDECDELEDPLHKCFNTLFRQTVQYHRGLGTYIAQKYIAKSNGLRVAPGKKIIVEVHYGDPGTGKSHQAYERFPNAYRREATHGQFWGAGASAYRNQSVVIFEDFTGSSYPLCALKRLLDKYPLVVNTKGSAVPMIANHFIFTSNYPPKDWYPEFKDNPIELNALMRRVTHLYSYSRPDSSAPIVVTNEFTNERTERVIG